MPQGDGYKYRRHKSNIDLLMIIGYLKFIEGFGLRVPSMRRRHIYEEFDRGRVIAVYDCEHWRIQTFVDECVVEFFDEDMKPTTWEAMKAKGRELREGRSGFKPPKQKPVRVKGKK